MTANTPGDNVPQLEPATLEDMDHVAELVRSSAAWYEPFVAADDMTEHDVDDAWAKKNHELRDFYVLRKEGEVIGAVSVQDAGDYAYLGYVYLHADHTGQGLGTGLLRFAVQESNTRGKSGMVLLAHPKATWAMRAYERFGFEVIAETQKEVLAWNDGYMKPYYEKGFFLHHLALEESGSQVA